MSWGTTPIPAYLVGFSRASFATDSPDRSSTCSTLSHSDGVSEYVYEKVRAWGHSNHCDVACSVTGLVRVCGFPKPYNLVLMNPPVTQRVPGGMDCALLLSLSPPSRWALPRKLFCFSNNLPTLKGCCSSTPPYPGHPPVTEGSLIWPKQESFPGGEEGGFKLQLACLTQHDWHELSFWRTSEKVWWITLHDWGDGVRMSDFKGRR